MKLHYFPPMASLAVLIAARELDIPVELVRYDPQTGLTGDGRRLAELSAKACIPVVERDDGSVLTETPVILAWLAARDPDLRLYAPQGSEEQLRIAEWLAYFSSEQHKFFSMLFWPLAAEAKAEIIRKLVQRFEPVEQALADQNYLMGARYTIADIYLLIIVRGMHLVPTFDLEASFPRLAAFKRRLEARPQIVAAMAAHGLDDWGH